MTVKNPDTTDTTSRVGYTILKFTTIGTGDFVIPSGVSLMEILVVGGGGSGGNSPGTRGGGGGGGGGIYTNNADSVTPDSSVTVTVGAGGGTSSFDTHTVNAGTNGTDGGASTGTGGNAGSGGYSGGSPDGFHAGGGAGNGQKGYNGDATLGGGAGGDGTQSNITGTNTYYGGGGSGGYGTYNGGNGGGGKGWAGSAATAGTANTGGGGGGGYNYNNGAAGGSGIVIIAYLTPKSSGPTFVALSEYGYMCQMMKEKARKYWEGWKVKDGIFQPEMGVI